MMYPLRYKVKLGRIFRNILRYAHLALNFRHGHDWLTLNCSEIHLDEKPGNLAILTQSFNEGKLLLYWEAYYGKMVGYENLFVLNNGSDDNSCNKLNPKTTVVNIPGGVVDLHNLAQMNGYFQRFLLLKYNWVLKVDVDEFMVCEGGMLESLESLPQGIYTPERAVAVIHDRGTEAAFDYTRPLFEQRACFIEEWPALKKPSLTSVPATWSIGNHAVSEYSTVLTGMWMIHLRYLDFDRLLDRNCRWASMKPTSLTDKSTKAFSGVDGNLIDFTIGELTTRISEGRVTLPDWLVAEI